MTAVATEVLKLVCSWCGKTLHEGSDPTSKVVSHGLCQSCRELHFAEYDARRRGSRAERS